MKDYRWWSAEELTETSDSVFPKDLAAVIEGLKSADR